VGIVTDGAREAGGAQGTLEKDGTKSELGGINFYFKRSVVVQAVQGHVVLDKADEPLYCCTLLVPPSEGDVLLQEVSKGVSNFGETRDKGAVIPKYTKGASHPRCYGLTRAC
jgi:hypothetical protein